MTEQQIAAACRQGDRQAQKALYQQYAEPLFCTMLRYVHRDDAEDLLHDAFIVIFRSFHKFEWRGEGSLAAWLKRVCINTALSALRKTHELPQLIDDTTDIDQLIDPSEQPDEADVEQLPADLLMQFIADLPEGYRTVFNLYVVDGLSHKEIARLLHIKERTSSSQFFRAKNLLAQKINLYLKLRNA